MKLLPFFFATVVAIGASVAQAQESGPADGQMYDELRETTIAPLFDSLKAGNLAGIKRHLHGDFYEQYRVLFEQNTEYGQFLRDYYEGSSYELLGVRKENEVHIAKVAVYWPDGRTVEMDLQVDGEGARRKVKMDNNGG